MAEDQEFVPPPLEERPLVTFALFAYNQEKYIREAVEGAFAQTYEPLEIILSDDCSTDDTFKIMLKLAADYSGPHQIICRQNCENIGTYNHVITVAREANGQFLIVNAGDDVSYPNRAEILVHNWLVTRAAALSSGYNEIDEKGTLQRSNLIFPPSKATQLVFGRSQVARKHGGLVLSVPGFCAGYDAAFLKSFSLSPKKLLIEDGTIGGVINILGLPIHQIDTALICYRIHQNSTTVRENDLNESTIRERELKISQHSASVKLMIEQIFIESVARGIEIEASVKKMLNIGLKYADNTYGFWEKNLFFRILTLTNCRSKDDLKFVVFRLFGFRVFYALRKMYSAIGKSR